MLLPSVGFWSSLQTDLFLKNTWEINSWPRWVCVSAGIYFGFVFRVKSNLEAVSDHFSEILLLSTSFSSCLALRQRKKIKACAHGHTLTWVSGSPDLNSDDLRFLCPWISHTLPCLPGSIRADIFSLPPHARGPWEDRPCAVAVVSPKSPPGSFRSSGSQSERRCSYILAIF